MSGDREPLLDALDRLDHALDEAVEMAERMKRRINELRAEADGGARQPPQLARLP